MSEPLRLPDSEDHDPAKSWLTIARPATPRRWLVAFSWSGAGAWMLFLGLTAFLVTIAAYSFLGYRKMEQRTRSLAEDNLLLLRDNQRLRSEVDKLQSELAKAGSLLRTEEALLERTAQTLRSVQEREEKRGGALGLAQDQERSRAIAYGRALERAKKLQTWVSEKHLTGISVGVVQDKVRMTLAQELLFRSGETRPHAEGIRLLRELSAVVQPLENDEELWVVAHTDSLPPSSWAQPTFPSNWEVSSHRAASVARLLATEGHFPTGRLVALGCAEGRPVAPNDTPDGRKWNRRIVLWILRSPLSERP
ncbi:OmpA family protein [Candidatus Methylacidithermus pantelleriae]|uniref:Flagellar motor rotation protein MotB n=1 Tax=Candidatus Methylacidithermus pantelleriae TaxID=2744239 RepID=A0A8J2FN23_9BACT|nr:OmpA family protein [Candidatus Methylacidithermus pantelleriae]CAF0692454.1 Flagellar motor rotation protein MotB [Candidatus Methylacidithermus pantelleriae]